jgi:hypothetical protein
VLRHGGRPGLVRTSVKTEAYSVPPNAVQKSGPFPYGQSLGQSGVAVITTDFDAVQEVTAAGGLLYAELDTGYNAGTGQRSAAAWFVLRPSASPGKVTAARVSNGYVKTPQFVMYPVIGVDAHGHGYLAFSFSSAGRFPSDGYVTFDGSKGAGSVVHVAASGVNPLDDFGCYPPNANGVCRMGDYSMAQNFDGKIYLGSEYVPPQPRDIESNWGTRIWYAPVP